MWVAGKPDRSVEGLGGERAEWPGTTPPPANALDTAGKSGWHIYPRPPHMQSSSTHGHQHRKKNRNGERGTPTRRGFPSFCWRRQPLLLCFVCVSVGRARSDGDDDDGAALGHSKPQAHKASQAKPHEVERNAAFRCRGRVTLSGWPAARRRECGAFPHPPPEAPLQAQRTMQATQSLLHFTLANIDSHFSHLACTHHRCVSNHACFARKEGRHAAGLLRRVGLGSNARILSALCTFFFVLVRRRPSSRYAHTVWRKEGKRGAKMCEYKVVEGRAVVSWALGGVGGQEVKVAAWQNCDHPSFDVLVLAPPDPWSPPFSIP